MKLQLNLGLIPKYFKISGYYHSLNEDLGHLVICHFKM